MRLRIDHLDEELANKLEKYLKHNKFPYFRDGACEFEISLTEEDLRKIHNLGRYLFVTLTLDKCCLHMTFQEYMLNDALKTIVSLCI